MLPQLNIREHARDVESIATIEGRHWKQRYATMEAAEHRAEPLGYSFFAHMPDDFDVVILRNNGWTAVAHRIQRSE